MTDFGDFAATGGMDYTAAAGGIIFCKVFGENILSFGGVCRHPIGDVTFDIIFCRGPNSTLSRVSSENDSTRRAANRQRCYLSVTDWHGSSQASSILVGVHS